MVTALILLAVGGGTPGRGYGFILLYGLGSGVLAVVRATLPLAFYDRGDLCARAASRIALPLNLVTAAAPPILATILTRFGGRPSSC